VIKPGKYYNLLLISDQRWTAKYCPSTQHMQFYNRPFPLTEKQADDWRNVMGYPDNYEVRAFIYDGSYDPYNFTIIPTIMPQPLPKDNVVAAKPLSKECPCGIFRSDCIYHKV
jgi:hypothetical protein